MTATAPRHRSERGMATVATIGLVGLLTVLALVASGIVGLVDAHRRAQAAADLAALAGGGALAQGSEPCAAAAANARRNAAELVDCRISGRTVAVVVAVAAPAALAAVADPRARARAGPVTPAGLAPGLPEDSGEQQLQ